MAISAALLARSDGGQWGGGDSGAVSGDGHSPAASTAANAPANSAALDATPWITAARREGIGQ